MKVTVIGGGPGGLYFALLAKKAWPRWDITAYERNRPDDTFGFGVVFSDQTLDTFKAYVVLKPGSPRTQALAKALQEHVKNAIAPYKYPRAVEFVDALPRTETGKLQRFKLRTQP